MRLSSSHLATFFAGAAILGPLASRSQSPSVTSKTKLAVLSAEQRQILDHMSIVYLDDGYGGALETIEISGVNVRLVNGLGATNGNPANPVSTTAVFTNGLGNLIVGYNETGNVAGDDRTGSHNVLVGKEHSYASLGGIAVGDEHTLSAPYAAVTGGRTNTASGVAGAVCGGYTLEAGGLCTTIGGGHHVFSNIQYSWAAGNLLEF